MDRKHRIVKWVALSLAVVFGLPGVFTSLAAAFFQIAPYFLRPKVDREIAAIRARGEPVTMADLAGPKIPNSQNGAVIYERVFKEMDKPQVAKDMAGFRFSPSPKVLAEHPEFWEQTRLPLKRCRYLIPLIEQAASKQKCRFNINWEDGPLDVRFPHLAKLRQLSRFLAVDAVANARNGNPAMAMRLIRIGFMMSESLKNQAHLLSQILRTSQVASMSVALSESLRYGSIRQDQAEKLYHVLRGIHLEQAYEEGLKGDRALGIAFLASVAEHPRRSIHDTMRKMGSRLEPESRSPEKIGGVYLSWVLRDELLYLRSMHKYIDAARLPYREIKSKGRDKSLDADLPGYALYCAILLPLSPGTWDSWERAPTMLDAGQVLLALSAYKDRFGSYPANLGELRTKLGWKIPEDPFSGKDFIYKRDGKGFLLYSIGPDLKDDGGKELPKNDRDNGDIVWRMER